MKKIKGILLFGILTLLGIGSSFGQFFDLGNYSGSQLLIPISEYISLNPKHKFSYSLGESVYFTGRTTPSTTFLNIYSCKNSSNNIVGFRGGNLSFGITGNCNTLITPSIGEVPSDGSSPVKIFNYLYMFSDSPLTPYSERTFGSVVRYFYFDFNNYYTYDSVIQDVPDGYSRDKIFLSSASNYGIVSKSTSDGSYLFTSLFNDGIVSGNVNSGFLLTHLNGFTGTYYDGEGTLLLYFSGESVVYNYYSGFYLNYSSVSSVSPDRKGYLLSSDSISLGYENFMSLLNSPGNFVLTKGDFSNNFVQFTYYYNIFQKGSNWAGSFINKGSYSFSFSENIPSIPDFIEVDQGGGNQSFPDPILDGGVFDANTYLIEESIKCYLTSGEVCNFPFTLENSTNYVNNYDHQERVRNSTDKTGYLTFNNSVDMLSQYCLNVNTIQYAFCSQLSLYEGFPITYYYNNGYFNYIILGSGWQVNLGTLWSGQLGYAYCEGPFCSNFNEGLPQFIRKDTGDYSAYGFSGEYVSLDFFKNYFENGFFFQCPFSYSGSYFTIGSKLIDRLDNHDPLKPINCLIAAFSYGVKSSFFGDASLGLSHSGTFMQNTGPNAIRFYTFFDILLSLGYIMFFSKLFKFLKKH